MSFSSLPTELVRQIIESTVPSAFHSSTYNTRQSTLKSLCLVSRQFCEIAQPHLRQLVWVMAFKKPVTQYFEVLMSKAWAGDVRHLVAVLLDRDEGSATLLKRLATICSDLETLVLASLDRAEGTDLELITRLMNLQSLHLNCVSYKVPTSSFCTLRTLSINFSTSYESGKMQKLLDPSFFPCLRVLGFIRANPASLLDTVQHSHCAQLFDQLDTFFMPIEDLSLDVIAGAQSLLLKTLIGINNVWLSQEVLRLVPSTHHARVNALHLLPLANALQEANDCKLRSLYLPPSSQAASTAQNVESDLAALLSACQDRKIEVIFETQAELDGTPSVLSSEFCRRQREARRLAEAQTTPV